MKAAFVLALTAIALVLWQQRNSDRLGETLRHLSDIPTNAILTGTSGFEREGRDPAKPD